MRFLCETKDLAISSHSLIMKKLLLLLATICFISCECPYCGEKNCRCGDDGPYGIHYDYDYFCAEKLLGEWQATYGCQVGNLELKDIKFFDGWRCDITMTQVRNTDWYTETWTYTYYGNTIKFARNDGRTAFSFKVSGYIYPELYLEDSFGTYTWRKIRPYSCIN